MSPAWCLKQHVVNWSHGQIGIEPVQLDNDSMMGGEFSARGGCRAGASEQGIVDMPVSLRIWEIGQNERRLYDQLTDNRAIDRIGAALALTQQDIMRLPVDRDDIDLYRTTPVTPNPLRHKAQRLGISLHVNPHARQFLPGGAPDKRAQVALDRWHHPLWPIVHVRTVRVDEAEIEAKKRIAQVIAPAFGAILLCRGNRGRDAPLDQFEFVELGQVGRQVTLADLPPLPWDTLDTGMQQTTLF